VRPEGADLGVVVRYLDGSDVELRVDGSGEPDFRESTESVVVSFLMRW
jgi:hypothetical protein